jgi:hypothetical protein
MWIEHCVARNQALVTAARALAENAALARALAKRARARGDSRASERLEQEASSEDRLFAHVGRLLEGLAEPEESDER